MSLYQTKSLSLLSIYKCEFTFIISLYYKVRKFTRLARLLNEYIILGNMRQMHISISILFLHVVLLMNILTGRDKTVIYNYQAALRLGVNETEMKEEGFFFFFLILVSTLGKEGTNGLLCTQISKILKDTHFHSSSG